MEKKEENVVQNHKKEELILELEIEISILQIIKKNEKVDLTTKHVIDIKPIKKKKEIKK